jgi:hypothetical protein
MAAVYLSESRAGPGDPVGAPRGLSLGERPRFDVTPFI